jgi:NADH-ubiquinone oxidoreductase chain 5
MFTGLGSDFFGNSIFILPNNITIIEAEFSISPLLKFIPLICTILGAFFSFYVYHYTPISFIQLTETQIGKSLYTFLNGKFYFDIVYNNFIISKGLKYGHIISKLFDRGILECVGPYGLSNSVKNTADNISKLDTGIITTYALYIVLSLLSLLFIVFTSVLMDQVIIDSRLLIIVFLYLTFLPKLIQI